MISNVGTFVHLWRGFLLLSTVFRFILLVNSLPVCFKSSIL